MSDAPVTDAAGHVGDALSAYLDGELGRRQHAEVGAHVAGCATCATELATVRAARLAIRTLPAVPPPVDLVELGRRSRPLPARRSRLLAGLGPAVAAVAVGLVLAVAAAHPATFVHPPALAGYQRVATVRSSGAVQIVYRRGVSRLTVYESRGRLDRSMVPVEATRLSISGSDAWAWDHPSGTGQVIVLGVDGLVVTLVGDDSPEALQAVAKALPGPPRAGLLRRLQHASSGALHHLGPGPG
ncbi:MAG: zf-HC2 domain-containing protein [Acidobacteria bacterium]|nr:zf-HC2 domain-containing protein [Acidobacteriota bacterium]